jgi:hypothetical protein
MLLFWLLALYVLTRSPRSLVSLAASGAMAAAAAYLLGLGMQANAETLDEWLPWARNLTPGATLAPLLWYWLTVLLLEEQIGRTRYVRWFAFPVGVALTLFATAAIALQLGSDLLSRWSEAAALDPGLDVYQRFAARPGILQGAYVRYLFAGTVLAAVNTIYGWRTLRSASAHPFGWLTLSAILFLIGAVSSGLAVLLEADLWPYWVSHLALDAAMIVMAWNVVAYNVLLKQKVIRRDLAYFFVAMLGVAALYALVLFAVQPPYSFELLEFVVLTLLLILFTHALVDIARRFLDRIFFDPAIRAVRSQLSSAVQDAALAPDVGALLDEAQSIVEEATAGHFARLTEQALRALNNPAALARAKLMDRLPRSLAAEGDLTTPLLQAQALRAVIAAAIERLKIAGDADPNSPAALQYNILREEYLQGMPNRQIMTRHSVSEGTFHRNRRQAIALLAQELSRYEDSLAAADKARF